jgi:hypothetical protein
LVQSTQILVVQKLTFENMVHRTGILMNILFEFLISLD